MDTKNLKENHFIIPPDEKQKFFESLKRKPSASPAASTDVPTFAEWQNERDKRTGRDQEAPEAPPPENRGPGRPPDKLTLAWDKSLAEDPPAKVDWFKVDHDRIALVRQRARRLGLLLITTTERGQIWAATVAWPE